MVLFFQNPYEKIISHMMNGNFLAKVNINF